MSAQISAVKCGSYDPDTVGRSVREALDLLGGIRFFVKPGSRVLVKPNLLMSTPPEQAITTHPQVVRSVIRLLKDIGCRVVLGDGPSVWGKYIENVDKVYEATGIKKVALEEGAELVNFDKRRMRDKFPLTVWLDECDCLVNLPKVKTHGLTLMTCAVKNLFGLVSGTYKTELHKNYFKPSEFVKVLVDIYQEARPVLTIADGVLAMEGDGPGTSGRPRKLGLLFAGSDCTALDAVVAGVMGITPGKVLSINEAVRRGLGEGDLGRIEIKGEDVFNLGIAPFALPQSSKAVQLPGVIETLAKSLVKYYPYSLPGKCVLCGHCMNICPEKCINLGKRGPVFDYRKCIACFCCQESCPSAAIGLKKSFLAKVIGL
ncbi:MAG: DUF362 domain-containing protein [Candidatus Omnitrophica bacterium]|nr:DUF362 domain-containing protein [Candidatus Omnitrophota bacterium]MDD5501006.1 DUF362 domain-containing protein [Candidatus Omnitrophota bacterium]